MNATQIDTLRTELETVFRDTIYPAGDKKVIAEFVSMYNIVRDYTARLKGYADYDHELAKLENANE